MHTAGRIALSCVLHLAAASRLWGGGSGLNVVVVANAASSNSLQLANYYCEKRGVPPQNVLRINWTGGNTEWTRSDLDNLLRTPLNAMLSSRNLSNQIDYVLLSMDIPYRVRHTTGSSSTSGLNSTTAALFYGFKPDGCTICPSGIPGCNLPGSSENNYAGSEAFFRDLPPSGAGSNSWLTMMLTSSNLSQAKAVVDRGVASDSTFPTQKVFLIHYDGDPLRGVRYVLYEDALFETRVRGGLGILRTNASSPNTPGLQLGSQFGRQNFGLSANLFAPGALADNLTSYSGLLFEKSVVSPHTHALEYLNAGATASYGTVTEPCNYLEKFPSPRNYFYQARGFTAAECYFQSVTNPYQGILVGEPLAAPFAKPGTGVWVGLPAGAALAGTTNLVLDFNAADATRPLQQVDLFLDGTRVQTLTNFPPRQNNRLYVTLNGLTTDYLVPAGATLQSVAGGLTAALNAFIYSDATKVAAFAHGDRIELRSLDLAKRGGDVTLAVSNHIGSATLLTARLWSSGTNFLDSPGTGVRSYTITNVAGSTMPVGSYLQLSVTKTNGAVVTLSITNDNATNSLNILAHQLVDAVNTNAALLAADGVVIEDAWMHEDEPWRTFVFGPNDHSAEFNLRARSPGWQEAQVQVELTGSPIFVIQPLLTNELDENVEDLMPRAHIYVTGGLANPGFSFGFNTATQADGFHELTAVANEGSHVRTQTRATALVRITNSPLAATIACLLCDSNTALEATLQFQVAANTNTITRIELFSTGGSWGVVSNQSTANFSLAATNLGAGLHPFYAVVMRNDGRQYRTETKWIRLNTADAPFPVSIAGTEPTLSWPATAGRRYEVLSTLGVTNSFALRDAVVPTNSPGRWSETNNAATNRFYRVRTAP